MLFRLTLDLQTSFDALHIYEMQKVQEVISLNSNIKTKDSSAPLEVKIMEIKVTKSTSFKINLKLKSQQKLVSPISPSTRLPIYHAQK